MVTEYLEVLKSSSAILYLISLYLHSFDFYPVTRRCVLNTIVSNKWMQTLYQNNLRQIANACDNGLIPSKKSFLSTPRVEIEFEVHVKHLKVLW